MLTPDTMRLRPYSALVPTLSTGQWTDHGRALYAVRLLAARMMLARWFELGLRFLVLDGGVCGASMHEIRRLPCWPLVSTEAAHILAASVDMGNEYAGWARALREALASVGATSPRCAACCLSGGDGEVVERAEGGFDDYPAHVTHACLACGSGWTEQNSRGAEQ